MKSAFLLLFLSVTTWGWMGIRTPESRLPKPKKSEDSELTLQKSLDREVARVQRAHDSAYAHRTLISIPIETQGTYLGKFYSIQCMNCEPGKISFFVQDSTSNLISISMSEKVWDLIPKPLKGKKVYDFHDHYLFFETKAQDSVYVAGSLIHLTTREYTCYPYGNLTKVTFTNF